MKNKKMEKEAIEKFGKNLIELQRAFYRLFI